MRTDPDPTSTILQQAVYLASSQPIRRLEEGESPPVVQAYTLSSTDPYGTVLCDHQCTDVIIDKTVSRGESHEVCTIVIQKALECADPDPTREIRGKRINLIVRQSVCGRELDKVLSIKITETAYSAT